jgi:hypothetical protein
MQNVTFIMSVMTAAVTGRPSEYKQSVIKLLCSGMLCIAHISVRCVTLHDLYLLGPLWLLMQRLRQDMQCTGQ